ncbi:MAG: hypothetical protein ACYTGN_06115 [Planctomycetota bacterium]
MRALVLIPLAALAVRVDAQEGIKFDRSSEAVIVRSGADHSNFLFRAPAAFRRAEAKAPYLVHLTATRDGAEAHIRLRVAEVAGADRRKAPATLAQAREKEYRGTRKGKLEVKPDGVRAVATLADRTVVLVRDGTKLYELFCDGGPAFKADLAEIADGFTILVPKGAPVVVFRTPEDLKAKTLEHDYYRLKLTKPAGFAQEDVDPDSDNGIWLWLRAEDEERNVCNIRIRVFLAKASKKNAAQRAEDAIRRFDNKYPPARVPKKPKRTRFGGAKEAFKMTMAGRLPKSGIVVQEEVRVVEHTNGRLYEFQLTTYAGAQRAFKKQISEFWKKLKILGK